jgi:hypothetical protein
MYSNRIFFIFVRKFILTFSVKARCVTLYVRANFVIYALTERKVVFMGLSSLCFDS